MEYLIILVGENLQLAEAEVVSLVKGKMQRRGSLLYIETTQHIEPLLQRFALVHQANQILFSCTERNIKKTVEQFDWNSIYKKNFCVRIHHYGSNFGLNEQQLAGWIWHCLKRPSVNLDSPMTKIEFFLTKNKIYATKRIYANTDSYQSRNVHLRPAYYPGSLDSRTARLAVNLTGITKGILRDPFCGSGSLLIEAGLMGLFPCGSDIQPKAIAATEKNLKHFRIKKYALACADATHLKTRSDFIACQLPFGRTIPLSEKGLYAAFVHQLKKILRKRAVIIFPLHSPYKSLLKREKLKLAAHYSLYVHKSLTRVIAVIEP